MSSQSDSYYSEYSDESSSDPSFEYRRRKRKEEKRRVKKDKKRAKKDRKKEKKERKKVRKELKKSKGRRRSRSRAHLRRSRSGSRSCSRRRSRSRSYRGSGGRVPAVQPFAWESPPRGCVGAFPVCGAWGAIPATGCAGISELAEVCERAGRGGGAKETVKDDDISVYGADERPVKPEVFKTFDEIKEFPRELRAELKSAGFPGPSQIQAYTWPLGLRNKDVIGIAATGSGKTLAFLLPAFAEMLDTGHRPERDGCGLLVMSPTRELAQQTDLEASRFGRCIGFRCVAMYGGSPKGPQLSKYRAGTHTIVACPGRLNDFLEGGQINLNGLTKLVLDEADRMLDMGFEPQIRKIIAKIPRKRHTLFFTATWPKEVRQLAGEILTKPYKVMIGNRDTLKGNQDITQLVHIVDAHMKPQQLLALLHEAGLTRSQGHGKALVFSNTKRLCEQLAQQLARNGVPVSSIHGDKDQVQRDEALNGLKTGRIKVLVATDVAARGLDIKGVGLVVNYDPANNTEDYVHRIGRTARAGNKGFAITLMTTADAPKARGIVEVMQRTGQVVRPELAAFAQTGGGGGGRSRYGRGGGKGGGHRDGMMALGNGGQRSPSPFRQLSRSPSP